jgi:hypothetical protein
MAKDRPIMTKIIKPDLVSEEEEPRRPHAGKKCLALRSIFEFIPGSIIVLRVLVEKKVGRELLVLIKGKVGLDDEVSFESKTAEL